MDRLMYPDGKTFWMSAVVMFAGGVGVIALGYVWLGVVILVFVALGVVMFFVRKSKGQIPDKRFAEPPVPAFEAPAPLAMPAPEEGLAEAQRLLQALHGVGIIAPDMPPLAQLQEALADYGEPVDVVAVLSALLEAHYYHADFAEGRYFANLRFHAEQVEQFAESLGEDFADLCHLAQCTDWEIADLQCGEAAAGKMRFELRARVATQWIDMDEPFFSKYRNADFYVRIARTLMAAGAPRRLAWLYSDSGIWLSGLAPETDLRILPAAEEGWRWVDEGLQ
ncbi:MAG: hypothetical protein Q4D61_03935 [Cardiobacteriaceae bacterium]|nr:hypothetical protein [Cardiobacteriaceae bacterium]